MQSPTRVHQAVPSSETGSAAVCGMPMASANVIVVRHSVLNHLHHLIFNHLVSVCGE